MQHSRRAQHAGTYHFGGPQRGIVETAVVTGAILRFIFQYSVGICVKVVGTSRFVGALEHQRIKIVIVMVGKVWSEL